MTPTALAAQPNRATTSFTLSWGLLNIPVSAYTGTQPTRVARKEFVEGTDVAVGRAPIRKDNGEVIDVSMVERRAQASNGVFVTLTDDEIADCTAPKGIGEIVSFVPETERGHYLAENQMQVRPKATKGKVDPAAERAFALLIAAMESRDVCALVKIAMRGPARYALLDYTGTFTLVYTADAIREARDLPTTVGVSDDEVAMALQLIDAVGVDTPALVDDTAPVVAEYVEAKAAGQSPTVETVESKPVTDVMADLLASIDAEKAKKGKKKGKKAS